MHVRDCSCIHISLCYSSVGRNSPHTYYVHVHTHRLMINFTEDESEPEWKGYLYAVLLFLAAVVQSLLLHQYFHRGFLVGMRVRTAVVSAVYNKVIQSMHIYIIYTCIYMYVYVY